MPVGRAPANRAWAEYVPAGLPYDPKNGPLEEIRIYRTFDFGNLARFVMTDERLYRDEHPYGNEKAEGRTMLGETQKGWFVDQILDSDQTWKLWGNETALLT